MIEAADGCKRCLWKSDTLEVRAVESRMRSTQDGSGDEVLILRISKS